MCAESSHKGLISISSKFGLDKRYTKRFFNDYNFAKAEAEKAGVEMDHRTYRQLCESFKKLINIGSGGETFEKIWYKSAIRNNHENKYLKPLLVSVLLATVIGCTAVYLAKKRSSKQ